MERVRGALLELYTWYRDTEAMTGNVQRDRRLLPELDALLAATSDRQLDDLADALAHGFARGSKRASQARALLRLALEFPTWKRLTADGLSDRKAAELMAHAAETAASLTTRP